MKKYILNYLKENKKNIISMSFFIIFGFFAGLILFNFINPSIQNDFINTMKKTLDLAKNENFEGINIIKNGLISNSILVLIIYLLSLNLFSKHMISMLSVLKGISLGIYFPTLFKIFVFPKSILAIILIFVLPNLVYIPSFIYLSCNSINLNYKLINDENRIKTLLIEIFRLVVGFSIMFIGVIIEQILSTYIVLLYV